MILVIRPLFVVFLLLSFFSCENSLKKNRSLALERARLDSLATVPLMKKALLTEIYSHSAYRLSEDEMLGVFNCFPDPGLGLKMNKKGQLMVQGEMSNEANLYRRMREAFTHNFFKNDLNSNQPFYSQLTKKNVEYHLDRIGKELKELKEMNAPKEMLDFKAGQIREWEPKLAFFELTKQDTFREILYSFHVHFSYQDSLGARRLKEWITESYLRLRDEAAHFYFHQSYYSLFVHRADELVQKKLRVLQIALPIYCLDLPYCRKEHIYTSHTYSVPSPLPE